jgi:hypothetical protein
MQSSNDVKIVANVQHSSGRYRPPQMRDKAETEVIEPRVEKKHEQRSYSKGTTSLILPLLL